MLRPDEIQSYLDVALTASIKAGKILKRFWGKLSDIREKKISGDLVTEADKSSEDEIIKVLRSNYPTHSILAEESGMHSGGKSEFLWAIDPLDGTTNYAHQFPFVAVSIALLYRGKPVVGVVHNPIMKEVFSAGRDCGSFLNQRRLHVSNVNSLEKSLLATGFSYRRRETLDNNFREFCHLTNKTQGVRRAGSASLDLAYVAAGQLDGFWENELNPWDIAAGVLLVEEAGGKVSSYDKTPLDFMKPKILATNNLLHHALSEELQAVSSSFAKELSIASK